MTLPAELRPNSDARLRAKEAGRQPPKREGQAIMSVHLHPKSFLAVGAVLALAGCLGLPAATAQSGDLQAAVNSALANDAALHGQQVTATVQNGDVTLSGTVQTEQQRQEAETAVANVPGVVGIADNIQVPGESQTTQAPPPPANEPQAQAPQTDQQAPPPPPDQTAPPSQPAGRVPYRGYGSAPQPPSGPVTVPAGTLLQIRTSEPLNVTKLQPGATFQVTVAGDVYEGNVLTIPRGAVLQGTVVNVKQPGRFGGSGVLDLRLTQLQLGGNSYPIETDLWSSKGPNKAGYTAGNTAGGAIMGAIIGGMIGRGPGAAVGALAGGGVGLLASGATNGPRIMLPPETLLNFHLAKPITVQPVSWQEAQRLAANAPRLQRRVIYRPYPYYPPPYPYYYPY
ncbi:MAG: BON domain-containing protein [Acidobacteriaceae bacterium]